MDENGITLLKIFDTLPDLVFYRDRDSCYQACNQAYADYVGLSIAEIIGRRPLEIMNQAEAENFMALDQQIMASGQPHQDDRWLTFPNQKKRLFNIVRSPLRDYRGEISGVAGICRDITEKELLKRLAEAESEKYRAALEVNPDPIIVYNLRGEVEYANPAFTETFGWAGGECLGRRLRYIPADNLEESRRMREFIKQGINFRNLKSRRLHKNGEALDVTISGSVFHDARQQIKGSIITLRNISEEKKLEEKLRMAQKMEAVGALAGGIAHDFNNLLTAIQGHLAIIRLRGNIEQMVEDKFSRIEQIIARGANLTKQLLGFARGGKYEIEILDLNQVIRDSLELFARAHKDLRVVTRLEARPSRVEADHGQLDQVLLNLYVNAWQAMQESGRHP
ncbi:MAG: PAS domain S-box protein, partial [Deltaproteobacteria bacterium]|nr:PAS domain S-box protein [Deltaproteobacteria bacterium]